MRKMLILHKKNWIDISMERILLSFLLTKNVFLEESSSVKRWKPNMFQNRWKNQENSTRRSINHTKITIHSFIISQNPLKGDN